MVEYQVLQRTAHHLPVPQVVISSYQLIPQLFILAAGYYFDPQWSHLEQRTVQRGGINENGGFRVRPAIGLHLLSGAQRDMKDARLSSQKQPLSAALSRVGNTLSGSYI